MIYFLNSYYVMIKMMIIIFSNFLLKIHDISNVKVVRIVNLELILEYVGDKTMMSDTKVEGKLEDKVEFI